MDKQENNNQEKIVIPAVEIRVFNHVVEVCDTVVMPCVKYDDGDPSVTIDKLNPLLAQMWTLGKLEVLQKGFMTSTGRFVDPIEAQKIAIACGQYRDPHARIKSLEQSIEVGWDSVKYAKTGIMISSLKKQIAEDQAKLEELKAGYLGNVLRVEDLHYV